MIGPRVRHDQTHNELNETHEQWIALNDNGPLDPCCLPFLFLLGLFNCLLLLFLLDLFSSMIPFRVTMLHHPDIIICHRILQRYAALPPLRPVRGCGHSHGHVQNPVPAINPAQNPPSILNAIIPWPANVCIFLLFNLFTDGLFSLILLL
jgi:hypothetical protein